MTFKNTHIVLVLLAVVGASIFARPGNAKPLSRNDIKQMVIEESSNSRVPPALALAVAKVESDFSADALSTAGARGVMQIMPKTARDEFGVEEDELWNPRLNIQLGIDFLAKLYQQYDRRWDLALSHYNGGTLKGRGGRAKPHSYTRQYVASVLRWQQRYEDQSSIWMVASNNARDGWRPARTRVENRLRQSLRHYARVKAGEISDSNDGSSPGSWRNSQKRRLGKDVRKLSDKPRIWVSWSTDRNRSLDFEGDFNQRLRRAKETLDDFGPAPS